MLSGTVSQSSRVEANRSQVLTVLTSSTAPMQPIFQLEQPPQWVRLKAPTPVKEVLSRRFRLRSHPGCHFLVVSTGRNEVTQRFRRQAGRLEKFAVDRAVETIGAGLAKEVCAAFVDQSRGPHGERVQSGIRAPRCHAIQIGCKQAKFFDIHVVSSKEGTSDLPGRDNVRRPRERHVAATRLMVLAVTSCS